jgi:MFS family permease
MSTALFRLVLFVSCAHALVHVYELAFASVEQLVATGFHVGKATTGLLGTCFAMPFGLFALAVGWLTDHWGAKRMLVTYLFGCAAACGVIWRVTELSELYFALFALGTFASIYHPAGLALLSHATTPANRPRALGLHGIFGSAGIGLAPFLAGFVLDTCGFSWQQYYALLMLPGILLGIWFLTRLTAHDSDAHSTSNEQAELHDAQPRWVSFFVLTAFGATMGLIYRAVLTFLPRYLDGAGISVGDIGSEGMRNYLTGAVLLVGIIGQYTAGRIARPHRMEHLLTAIVAANVPALTWMALAQGAGKVWAAGLFALVHFMNQPIYNSLIANYTPRRRRSLCYGFSFLMSFGVGSFGSTLAGFATSDVACYGMLAGLASGAAVLAGILWWLARDPNAASR